jgi:hypothetical protein
MVAHLADFNHNPLTGENTVQVTSGKLEPQSGGYTETLG